MAINLEYLDHFITAAQYHNFTLAADQLFMSQSTLSRQIKDLEEEFGVELFVRNGKTVTLTPAGTCLYKNAVPLITHSEQVKDAVLHSATSGHPRISIYTMPGNFKELTEVYRRLKSRGYQFEVRMYQMQHENPRAALENEQVDFLITYEPFFKEENEYKCIPFTERSFCVACSPSHPFAEKESVTLEEALQENVLFGQELPLRFAKKETETAPLPEGTLHMTLESFFVPVMINEGIIILPDGASTTYSSELCYIPISDKEIRYRMLLVYKKSRPLIPLAQLYAQELATIYPQDRPS